jgi:programmed cell death protein 5
MNYVDLNQMKQMEQIEALKKQILSKILSKEAYERLGRVRSVNPELSSQAELYLLQIYQSGKLSSKVTDEQIKEILRLLSERRDFKITKK